VYDPEFLLAVEAARNERAARSGDARPD